MFNAAFDLEVVEDVPQEEQRKAADVSVELIRDGLNSANQLDSTLERLGKGYQKELRNILGDKNLERYIELRSKLHMQVQNVIHKAAPTVAGERDIQEARQQATEESRKFLRSVDFNMAKSSELRGDYHTRFKEALDQVRGKPDEPNYVVLPEMVPKDVHNPWAVRHAPYPGWAWEYSWHRSDEPWNPSFMRFLDPVSGELGTYTHTHVSGADDSDDSYVRYRTAMRFWYQMPAAGLVEVWMEMQCIDTPYSGWLSDEWGWSDSACDQESYARLQIISPGPGVPRYSTILDYRRTGTDANWSNDVTKPGYFRWAHLFSTDTYPAGAWLLLDVGSQEWNHFWSNDVSIHSVMTMRWFLRNVYVRSTGE